MAGEIDRAIEARRWTVDRIGSMAVTLHRVSGKILVRGTGEVAVDVNFPVTFVDQPILSFGAALDVNQSAAAGNYPTISIVALRWKKQEKSPGDDIGWFYGGATLGIVTEGKTDQLIWAHWSAEGKAFRNPKGKMDELTDPI